ncbi:MAG: putative rane protein [Gemmatimonadetes bacterium]|nr:putative rane protein [Gemmatimonadota bacterium]
MRFAGTWLLTYLVHSTVMLCGVALLSVVRRAERWEEFAWRTAMFGSVITAFIQMYWPPAHSAATASVPVNASGGLLPIVVAAWIVVAVVRLATLARAHRVLRRLVHDREPVAGLAGVPARVSVSRRIMSPMVISDREICLPAWALVELSADELEAVLAHETAHIARHDRAWLYATACVERVLFVQPLNALAASRLRDCAERACDDLALARCASPVALASALARAAEWIIGAPARPLVVGMATHGSLALERVRRILDPAVVRLDGRRRPLRALFAVAALTAVVLLAPVITSGPLVQYTISAHDEAGPFTLTLERGRVVGGTVDGAVARLRQSGDRVEVVPLKGEALRVTLTRDGGITWLSREKGGR